MSETKRGVEDEWVGELEHWTDGPPHALFEELRSKCPVHWTPGLTELPDEAGYWSVTRADDVRTVSRDWRTYSSELGGVIITTNVIPLELARSEFIGMDPPKHDRLKAVFQQGFTPKRIAAQEPDVRAIVIEVLDRLDGRETCDLVTDVGGPVTSRVTGRFMGIPPEDDIVVADVINALNVMEDPDFNPGGLAAIDQVFERLFDLVRGMITERRQNPSDDLTSVLVHSEIDGQRLEEHEIVMGFELLVAGGIDSTKATYCSGMRALMEHPDQRRLLVEDPSLIPSAVEESLRMFPPFAHFRRTATRDTELGGKTIKKGDKVLMWYVSSNRDESRYEDPQRFDVRRNPEHQAFGAGGRHFCLGHALARLELRVLFEETLKRYPDIKIDGQPMMAQSTFVSQLKTLPVQLGPRAA